MRFRSPAGRAVPQLISKAIIPEELGFASGCRASTCLASGRSGSVQLCCWKWCYASAKKYFSKPGAKLSSPLSSTHNALFSCCFPALFCFATCMWSVAYCNSEVGFEKQELVSSRGRSARLMPSLIFCWPEVWSLHL